MHVVSSRCSALGRHEEWPMNPKTHIVENEIETNEPKKGSKDRPQETLPASPVAGSVQVDFDCPNTTNTTTTPSPSPRSAS